MRTLEKRFGDKVVRVQVDSDDPKVIAYAQNQLDTYEEREEQKRLNTIRRGKIERLLIQIKSIDGKILNAAKHYAPFGFQPFVDSYSALITSTLVEGGAVLGLINQRELSLIHELRRSVPIELYEEKKRLEKELEFIR